MPNPHAEQRSLRARDLFELARPCFHYARRGTGDGGLFEASEVGQHLMKAMHKIADQLEADGMVLVPREPTEAMLEAVKPGPAHWPKEGPDFAAMNAAYVTDQGAAQSMWREMIEAWDALPAKAPSHAS